MTMIIITNQNGRGHSQRLSVNMMMVMMMVMMMMMISLSDIVTALAGSACSALLFLSFFPPYFLVVKRREFVYTRE